MVDPGRVGRLAVEPCDGVGVVRHGLRHNLDGAFASHLDVLAEIDRAHATFAQLLLDVIIAADDGAHEIGGSPRGCAGPTRRWDRISVSSGH